MQKLLKAGFILVVILCVLFIGKAMAEWKGIKYVGAGAYPGTTISFDGDGEVFAAPDIANINFTVRDEATKVKDAQDKVSRKVSEAIAMLKKIGIAEKDIKTQGYNSYPKYEYPRPCLGNYPCPPANPKISGFEVSETIAIKVRDIEKTSDVLDGLAQIGVTEMNGPNFAIDKEDDLKAEARGKAITAAKNKARVLAKDLGVRLVRIVNFTESGSNFYPIYGKAEFLMADSGGPAPAPELPAGENKISSHVTITYEIR